MTKTNERAPGPQDELAHQIRREIDRRAPSIALAEVNNPGERTPTPVIPQIDTPMEPGRARPRMVAIAAVIALLLGTAAVVARRDSGPIRVSMPEPGTQPANALPGGGEWRALPAWPDVGELGSNNNGREDFATVAAGSEVIVWGGRVDRGPVHGNGAILDLRTDTWRAMADGPLGARYGSASAWTGTEMVIVEGSGDETGKPGSRNGAAYNPSTNQWRSIAASPIAGGLGYRAVWTGTEVVVAGGAGVTDTEIGQQPPDRKNEAAAYNPATDTWRALPPLPLDLSFLELHWSGTEVLVAGGQAFRTEPGCCTNGPVLVAALDPTTGTWRTAPASPTSAQAASTAWTGSELLAVPYTTGTETASTWDPVTNTWTPRPLPNDPDCEAPPVAVGISNGAFVMRCGITMRFDPSTHRWDRIAELPESPVRPIGFAQRSSVFAADSVAMIAGDGRGIVWTQHA